MIAGTYRVSVMCSPMGRHSAPAGHRPSPPEQGTPSRSAHSHRARRGSAPAQHSEIATSAPQIPAVTFAPDEPVVEAVAPARTPDPLTAPAPLPVPASLRAPATSPDSTELPASEPSAFERLGLAPAHSGFVATPAPAKPESKPEPAVEFETPPAPTPVVIAPVPKPEPVVIAPVPKPKPAPAPVPAQKPAARVATLERPAAVAVAEKPIEIRTAPTPAETIERVGLAGRVRSLPRVLLDTVAWGGFAAVVALIVIALSDVGMGRAAMWAVGLSGIVVLAVAVMAVTGTHLDDLHHASGSAAGPTERPE